LLQPTRFIETFLFGFSFSIVTRFKVSLIWVFSFQWKKKEDIKRKMKVLLDEEKKEERKDQVEESISLFQ